MLTFLESRLVKIGALIYFETHVKNMGRVGTFRCDAEIREVELESYPQKVGARYPVAWKYTGRERTLQTNESGVLVLAEYSVQSIQDRSIGVALLGFSETDQRTAAMFNDVTAEWNLKLTVYRARFRWLDRNTRLIRVKAKDCTYGGKGISHSGRVRSG